MSKKAGLPITLKMRHDFHYVDELSNRTGAPVGRMIPIDRLMANPEQPRQVIGDLSDLTASILEKGVLEPILVRHDQETDLFMIISGERRYRASLAAGSSLADALNELSSVPRSATTPTRAPAEQA